MFKNLPLLSCTNSITLPIYCWGTNIFKETQGSLKFFNPSPWGKSEGLCTSSLPSIYSTDGVVAKSSAPNSPDNLSCTTSACKSPKNPHLNPAPKAVECSKS